MGFALQGTAVDPEGLSAALSDVRAGGLVTFEGRVRDHSGKRAVTALEYEAFGPLAQKEGDRILAEALVKFGILAASCTHRTGRLAPGDIAVWVGVAAEHRGDAFTACRYVIDEIKARLPIWKKEHFAGGEAEWVNCAAPPIK